ncbi:MAG: GH3 auxin-responsive promoter family protein [Candidatus Sericytochromatia bacterium]|nr:GH3 auxin-responsive promoter family protein [Candidatus Sericytochromatia bacterium]
MRPSPGLLIRAFGALRFAHFERACQDPRASQARALARYTRLAHDTAFGRAHGLTPHETPESFAAKVPIRDYEGFRPYVARTMAGEPRVLAPDAPTWYVTTSGTTGEPKYIPVTPRWYGALRRQLGLWLYGVARDHPGTFDGALLTIVSPAVEGHTAAGTPCGSMSGLTNQRAPGWLRSHYAVPQALAWIADHEARYAACLRLAMQRPLSLVMTPNPSTLLRLAAVLEAQADTLLAALAAGTLGQPWPALMDLPGVDPDAVREALTTRLSPDPARARAIAARASRAGRLLPAHVWPELRFIGTWLGGSVGLHAPRLRQAWGETAAMRDLGLLASEGRLTVPLTDDTPVGPLDVLGNYYEFIPEDALDAPHPPVLGAHQLEVGARYYVILTSGNGLPRYDLHDVVEVRGHHHRTPCVAFLRKGRDMLSLTGEKLHVNQLLAAVAAASEAAGLGVRQCRLVGDAAAIAYDLLVEPWEPPGAADALPTFARVLDARLAELNVEYASKRASGRLPAPRVCLMRPGWSEALTAVALAAGVRDAQLKWKVLADAWDATSPAWVAEVAGDAR